MDKEEDFKDDISNEMHSEMRYKASPLNSNIEGDDAFHTNAKGRYNNEEQDEENIEVSMPNVFHMFLYHLENEQLNEMHEHLSTNEDIMDYEDKPIFEYFLKAYNKPQEFDKITFFKNSKNRTISQEYR